MEKTLDTALVWFRRDLRVDDHAALYHACRAARRVWCVFVFDRDILDPLPRADRRVEFIHGSVVALSAALERLAAQHGVPGVRLAVLHGHAVAEIVGFAQALHVQAVYANHDDDPAALQRDLFTLKARSTFGTANEKGVGLGLMLCKEFTEQQGGRISFESIPGRGSSFYIFMPLG